MKKLYLTIAALFIFVLSVSAQSQLVQTKTFDHFSTVKVEDSFVVKFFNSDTYSAKVNSDERIAAHIQCYVKNSTLYVLLDEKGFTRDLKKELNQKGVPAPVLEVEIYMPTIKSLIFSDKVSVLHSDEIESDHFTLTMTSSADVSSLNVTCATAEINIDRSSKLNAEFNVSDALTLNSSGMSSAKLVQNGGNAKYELKGSAYVEARVDMSAIEVVSAGSAESYFSGKAESLSINAGGTSKVNTELLEAVSGDIVQENYSKCYVNVTDSLKVNLTGSSLLTFKGTPAVEVERIVNSTMIKFDDPKRK